MNRWLAHLLTTNWPLRRRFPPATLAAIRGAIAEGERVHGGEVRVAIEACLGLRSLMAGQAARARAVEVFTELRVWDTEANNGVLIYLLLADCDIEIVADRGFAGRVSAAEWEAVCRAMEAHFQAGRFEAGAVEGIRRISNLIARHYPPQARDVNELPDAPAVL
jgi:uncharacterized membrane protein